MMEAEKTAEKLPRDRLGAINQVKLLVVLDALLREGSVSRAADCLGLQVSAVSRILGELRGHYGDLILVRTGRGMRPTPFAESLRLRVRALGAEAEALLAPAGSSTVTPLVSPVLVWEPMAAIAEDQGWLGKGLMVPAPLAVTPADRLEGAPTPIGIARRIAAIGDNADPHRRLARYIATTAPGPGRSRPLTHSEARDALSIILQGQADPLQVGALLMTIQYRGPSASELAGFADAMRQAIVGLPARSTRPDLDWPAYISPRLQTAPWFIHAARLVAMAGHRVLLHGHFGSGADSGKLETAAQDAGIAVCLSAAEVDSALKASNIAYVPLGALVPQVQSLLGLYPLFEMRTPLNAAVNMINPFSAAASIVGASQASRRDLYRDVAQALETRNIAVIGSTRDIAEFTPDKAAKIYRLVDGESLDTIVPAFKTRRAGTTGILTQREYWRAVWTGAARDPKAESIIVHTAAVAFLSLSANREMRFDKCLEMATELWATRKRNN
ncbi:glycosyl transferase family protein [Agrobacterium vitis]|nr:glycosyl transferase family protein [Agrobacterium vitis]